MAASLLIAYGADALEGYGSSATACSSSDGGTQIEGGSGDIYLVSAEIEDPEYGFFFANDNSGLGSSFYGDEAPTITSHSFATGNFIYVTAQALSPPVGGITNLTAGWYEIVFLGEFAYGIYYNASEEVLAQPTACAASSEEINFTTGTYAPNYLTASDTFTYGVIRTDATAAPLFVEIDISASSTAVEGIDYTRPLNTALTLSWASATDGTETFNVTTLINPAYTASTFIPYIRSSSIADIVGTASYASSSIIYPGTLDFAVTGSQVNEGVSQDVIIIRSSGSNEELTARMLLAGTAVEDENYTFTDLTKVGAYVTASFADGDDEYTFTINTLQSASLTSSVTLNFTITELDYPASGTQNYPEANIGPGSTYAFIMNNYDTGSIEMSGSGYNIYTASMPITWSVDRFAGSDGPVTATIDLIASGGYATGVFSTDYTSSVGTFPFNLTWADGDFASKNFSILTLANSELTGVSVSPYISSASVILDPGAPTSSAAWITHPGEFYIEDDTSAGTVVEGQSYDLTYFRASGTVGGLTGTLSYTGSAVSGTDYTFGGSNPPDPVTNRVWSDDGDTLGNTFTVTTTDDSSDEDNETIIIYLNQTSGTIYEFVTTGDNWGTSTPEAFAFDTGSLFGISTGSTVTIIDNESGSVRINNLDGYNIYTANMPVTWSVERYGGSQADGIATATIDLVTSGGYGRSVYGLDYTSSSGSFPYSFTWADQESGSQTFSIQTLANAALTGTSISPAIISTSSSFGTMLGTGSATSSAAWITHPGYAWLYNDAADDTVVEGGSFNLQYRRDDSGGLVGELTATLSFTGTAVSGTDYTFPEASPPKPSPLSRVSWAEGDLGTGFTIQTTDDSADEGNETIVVYLNSTSGTIYKFFTTSSAGAVETWTSGFAFDTGSLIDTDVDYNTSSVTILDNESGTLNFAPEFAGTIYITGSTATASTLTYSVVRSGGGDFAATASISTASANTAVEGIDYTGSSTPLFPLSLNWTDQEEGSKTFTVNFLKNTAYTGTLFIPEIGSSTNVEIGTASFSSGTIVYPGILDFTLTGSQINEGQDQVVTINRSSGSDGQLTATLVLGGTAVENTDYTYTNLTKVAGEATAAFGDGDSSYSFTINTIQNPASANSATLDFSITELEYPLSGTKNYPEANIGTGSSYAFIMNNYDTGSLEMIGSGYNIYTASMPITWSVDRYSGSDGPVTATIDLAVSGGFATGVFNVDYSGSSGTFPFNLTWADGDSGSKEFSVITLKRDPSTSAISISPYISSASVTMLVDVVQTSSATWITYPGYVYLSNDTADNTVVEGNNYELKYHRYNDVTFGGGIVGEITATLSFTGTATSGTDYTFPEAAPPKPDINSRVSWGSGSYINSFTVATADDAADEGNETIVVYLNSTSGTIYRFLTDGNDYGPDQHAAFAFDTGSLIDTDATYQTSSVTIIDNESGSVRINNLDGYNIYTASMPITWSVERYGAGDGIATASVNLIASGGYATGVFEVDYTSSSGSFPYSFTWADQETGSQTFSISTLDNSGDPSVAISISPAIISTSSSFGTMLGTGSATSSAAWVTYPGYVYLANDTSGDTVVEGGSYGLQVLRPDAGTVGELTATLSYTGSAISGTDYTFPDSVPPTPNSQHRISFEDGDADNIFTVQTTDDAGDEDNETIIISLNETSGTIYKFFTTGKTWTDNFAFDTGSLFSDSNLSNTVTILDNESGSVDFLTTSASIAQNSSIIISVSRGGGADFQATATIDQYSGTALKGVDYSGLPASVYWQDQESGTKTFTIETINPWMTGSKETLGINFKTLVNIATGTTKPTEEIMITNTIIEASPDAYPAISPNGVINNFHNAFSSLTNKGGVPFAYGIKTPFSVKQSKSAYSASEAGKKNI